MESNHRKFRMNEALIIGSDNNVIGNGNHFIGDDNVVVGDHNTFRGNRNRWSGEGNRCIQEGSLEARATDRIVAARVRARGGPDSAGLGIAEMRALRLDMHRAWPDTISIDLWRRANTEEELPPLEDGTEQATAESERRIVVMPGLADGFSFDAAIGNWLSANSGTEEDGTEQAAMTGDDEESLAPGTDDEDEPPPLIDGGFSFEEADRLFTGIRIGALAPGLREQAALTTMMLDTMGPAEDRYSTQAQREFRGRLQAAQQAREFEARDRIRAELRQYGRISGPNNAFAGQWALLNQPDFEAMGADEPCDADEKGCCTICAERRACCMFLPCGHLHLCIQCTKGLYQKDPAQCPDCRAKITSVHRAYQ